MGIGAAPPWLAALAAADAAVASFTQLGNSKSSKGCSIDGETRVDEPGTERFDCVRGLKWMDEFFAPEATYFTFVKTHRNIGSNEACMASSSP